MGIGIPPNPDDALFVLLQSMGYGPNWPLWQYQQWKREAEERRAPVLDYTKK